MQHDDLVVSDAEAERMEAEAYALGAEHGRNAASWYFDGNTTSDTYRRVWRGIQECDPEVFDTFPGSPLSGEWADSTLPRDVLQSVGCPEHVDFADYVVNMYEDGYGVAVADTIERACVAALFGDGSPLQRGTYARERDGATLLYHSPTRWNDPAQGLADYVSGASRSTLYRWRRVDDPAEQAAVRHYAGDNLRPGEWFETPDGVGSAS